MADASEAKPKNPASERSEAPAAKSKGIPTNPADAFWLTDLYPDAAALFQHKQASLQAIMADCIVVLDANVLLWPFELEASSLDDIEKVYRELADRRRLIVPGQAAREYYKNRGLNVAKIADALDGVIKRCGYNPFDKHIPLLSEDEDYKAAKKLNADIINAGKELAKRLSAVRLKLKDQVGGDRVSLFYQTLLPACLVDMNLDDNERKHIVDDAARRARLGIAPGFKDLGKPDGGIGDLIIWKTILQEGKNRRTNCIFITNEEKTDWWTKSQGIFQPRPELIEEYRRVTDGKTIHLLPLSGLLATFKADTRTVEEVQKLEEEHRERRPLAPVRAAQSRSMLSVHRQYKMTRLREAISRLEMERDDARRRIAEAATAGPDTNDLIVLADLERVLAESVAELQALESLEKRPATGDRSVLDEFGALLSTIILQ